jgi:hypothetical protein
LAERLDHFIDSIFADVVFAVGNQQDRFLIFLSILRHFFGCKIQRVVQGCLASGVDIFKSIDEIANAAGEVLLEVCRIIKIDDARLVFRITFAYK